MIKNASGKAKWNGLSEGERSEQKAAMLEQLVIKLGKEAFELLSDDEKHVMKLFIWAVCVCYKDLNTVWGGYAAVARWWLENNVEQQQQHAGNNALNIITSLPMPSAQTLCH